MSMAGGPIGLVPHFVNNVPQTVANGVGHVQDGVNAGGGNVHPAVVPFQGGVEVLARLLRVVAHNGGLAAPLMSLPTSPPLQGKRGCAALK